MGDSQDQLSRNLPGSPSSQFFMLHLIYFPITIYTMCVCVCACVHTYTAWRFRSSGENGEGQERWHHSWVKKYDNLPRPCGWQPAWRLFWLFSNCTIGACRWLYISEQNVRLQCAKQMQTKICLPHSKQISHTSWWCHGMVRDRRKGPLGTRFVNCLSCSSTIHGCQKPVLIQLIPQLLCTYCDRY